MNIFEHMKGKGIVEANNLNGLRQGHMLAQSEFDPAGFADAAKGELDNGYILTVNNEAKLVVAGAGSPNFLLHYSEEHMKFLDSAPLDMFTVYFSDTVKAYPRAIFLKDGDTFTTNNFNKNSVAMEYDKYYELSLVGGKLTVVKAATAETTTPIAKLSSLPAGQEAIEVFWKGGF